MPAGRPTKYTDETADEARQYMESGYLDYGVIPSTVGLAEHLDVTRATLDNWGKDEDKPEFFDILNKIQQKQARLLLNSGLDGTFNSAITKLVLGKHGYHERQEVSGPDGGDIGLSAPWAVNPVRSEASDRK